MGSITSLKCVLTQEHLDAICAKYFVPEEVHPQLPSSDATMHERPAGKVGMYTRFFDYANYRIPFSTFFVSVLTYFRIPFSQLSVFGSAKVSHFEIMFRYFYTHNYKNGWFGFTKRPNVRACYSKNMDSVKNWNDHFFWVDEFVVPANARFSWFSSSNIVKDRAPAPSEYNVKHVNTLIAQASSFLSITSLKCVLTQEHLDAICAKYFVPEEVHPQLPSPDATMHERPTGKVGMYTRFFDYANYRIPFSTFFVSVLTHFRIPFSQLSVFGSAKVSHFEILCRVCDIEPNVSLFRYFYTHNYKNGWFGFTKRPNVRACYSKNLDSVKNWNDHFFWVDEFVVPANARFSWFLGSNIVKDRAPAPSEYNVEHVNTLIAQASSFLRFPEEFLCWVGICRNYLLNKDTYPRLVYENGEGMDLNAFIRTADPRKVRIVKRPRAENERPIVTVAKHRTVASRFSLNGRTGPEVDSLVRSPAPVMTEATTVATVATTVAIPADVNKDKSAPHPSVFGSSRSSEKTDRTLSLFAGRSGSGFDAGSIRAEEAVGVGSKEIYVPGWTVTREGEDRAKSCDLTLILLVRSWLLGYDWAITVIPTTWQISTDVSKDKRRSGSGFDAGSIRAEEAVGAGSEEIYVLEWNPPTTETKGCRDELMAFNVSAARNLSLSSEVRMRAEYNILEKRNWRSLAEEKNILLEAKGRRLKI
ncbi:hypothetical protein Tco_0722433 [Tanacetum coccineum]